MHIEFRHLRTIKAIHETGGLARAADLLGITQSALSHQIKGIEDQAGVELFVRRSKPLKLSSAGQKLLAAADDILPRIAALEVEFGNLVSGKTGRLHIAIEWHACFDWLFPVLERFRHSWPHIDVDIRPGLAFDALPALLKEEVDVVISSAPVNIPGIEFTPMFDYAPLAVIGRENPLSQKEVVSAEDFRSQTLITYPVERSRLDVFSMLLTPARVEPQSVRQVELSEVILMLVASNRGVAVLPDWVLRHTRRSTGYVTRPLERASGITQRLFAATRSEDTSRPHLAHFARLARQEAVKLQR